ncbi:MAG: cell envelope integrity protein TolA [Defluviitaleaceae bacterium]|nr:cell envelope integrity protein TolA [Defluviitaleaceae bacterium]
MYKRYVIALENKGTAILETGGKISITMQNLNDGKYKLYVDNMLIENLYPQNGRINKKIKTDCDVEKIYNIFIKKEEQIIAHGKLKETPQNEIINLDKQKPPKEKIVKEEPKELKQDKETEEIKKELKETPKQDIIKEEAEPIMEQKEEAKPIMEQKEEAEPIMEQKEEAEPIIEQKEETIQQENLQENNNIENTIKDSIDTSRLELFKSKPTIQPFKKQLKPYSWINLNIHDLVHLPIEIWPFSRDQYILACYRKYKHFIFGQHNGNYILGIPDIYKSKNKVMLNRRGFMQFKSHDDSKVKDGVSGYWLMPIVIL